MAATVSIDFRVGGADAVQAMTRSISQSLEAAAKSAARASQQANQMQLIGARALAANQQTILRGRIASELSAHKAAASAARTAETAKTAIARTEANNRTAIARTEMSTARALRVQGMREAAAAQRQLVALEARAARSDANAARSSSGAFRGVMGGAVVSGVTKGVSAVTQGARAVVGGIAGGAGIDASIQHGVKQRMDQGRMAADLSNAGYLRGAEGPNGKRVASADIMARAQEVGAATASDPTKVIEAMATMTSVSGDLASSMGIVGDLAKLSRASGSDLNDMAAAAGNVAAQLGDVTDAAQRAKIVESVMRTVAGQGQLGAVEVKDMASQMAKLAARAAEFAGGDVETTMASLGALAQEARAKGGAADASQAATSVGSFINQFSKGARRKEMAKAMGGMDKVENAKGQLLDPEEIIVNMLNATGGDKDKMAKLIADSQAQKVTRGFQSIYNNTAGGKTEKEAAVRTEIQRLKTAGLSGGAVDENFKTSMDTAAAKAELFQQRLDKMTADMAEKIMPALIKLAPAAEKAGNSISEMAVWASKNPFEGVGIVIGASVAKEVASAGIAEAMKAAIASGGIGPAVAAALVTAIVLNGVVRSVDDADKSNMSLRREQHEISQITSRVRDGTYTSTDEGRLESARARVEGGRGVEGFFGNMADSAMGGVKGLFGKDAKVGMNMETAGNVASLVPWIAALRGIGGGILSTEAVDKAAGGNKGETADRTIASIDSALAAIASNEGRVREVTGSVTVSNLGEINVGGRDPATSPITGKLCPARSNPSTYSAA